MKNICFVFALICSCLLLQKCNESSKASYGESCERSSECESGLCIAPASDFRKYCSQSCNDGEPCSLDWACTIISSGEKYCYPPCTFDYYYYNQDHSEHYACVEGATTSCSFVPSGLYCYECGCNEGEYCNTDVSPSACNPSIIEGDPCEDDIQCSSGNCGKVNPDDILSCLTAIGSACTDENCELCHAEGAYCSRYCNSDDECGDKIYCAESSPDYPCTPDGVTVHCAGHDPNYWCNRDCTVGDCDSGGCYGNETVCPGSQDCIPVEYGFKTLYYSCFEAS